MEPRHEDPNSINKIFDSHVNSKNGQQSHVISALQVLEKKNATQNYSQFLYISSEPTLRENTSFSTRPPFLDVAHPGCKN